MHRCASVHYECEQAWQSGAHLGGNDSSGRAGGAWRNLRFRMPGVEPDKGILGSILGNSQSVPSEVIITEKQRCRFSQSGPSLVFEARCCVEDSLHEAGFVEIVVVWQALQSGGSSMHFCIKEGAPALGCVLWGGAGVAALGTVLQAYGKWAEALTRWVSNPSEIRQARLTIRQPASTRVKEAVDFHWQWATSITVALLLTQYIVPFSIALFSF